MKRYFTISIVIALMSCGSRQQTAETIAYPEPEFTLWEPEGIVAAAIEEPEVKLIVGITVDQMRMDYLTRFAEDYGNGGLRRLMQEGTVCWNAHYDYVPTFTGPGHACIYTGTGPAHNGIIANDWYDRKQRKRVYCAQDDAVQGVGTQSDEGRRSPVRLKSTTICDQQKLHTNFRSKTIGVAMKDRGGILPAGRTADASYWYIGGNEGNWVTSSWYMDQLPAWVSAFNKEGKSEQLMQRGWSLLCDESVYDESLPDNTPYETPFSGMIRPVFPYVFADDSIRAKNRNYDLIKSTPLGMELTTDFALRAIQEEGLGQDEFADFLCLSYSGTDYVGHRFGTHAREVQDAYLRLDQEIERLLRYLDQQFPGQYIVFLTADHGAAEVPSHMEKEQMKAGYWNPGNMVDDVKSMLNKEFGPGEYVLDYINDQFFLDRELIAARKIDMPWMQRLIAARAMEYEGVYAAYTADKIQNYDFQDATVGRLRNGWYPKLSGDVLVVLEPGWIEYGRTGTTHGSGYAYDTHVPVIFYGSDFFIFDYHDEFSVSDIAPTISARLGIMEPNGTTGKVHSLWLGR